MCELGWCAYPDDQCPGTLLRFDENAGDGLAGECVGMIAGTDSDMTSGPSTSMGTESTSSESSTNGPSTTMDPTDSATSVAETDTAGQCGGAGQACCVDDGCDADLTCQGGTCGCVVDIVSGPRHNCLLKVDGSVSCWGANNLGQLGNTANAFETTPIAVNLGAGMPADALSAYFTTCAHRSNNVAICWGDNGSGQVEPADIINTILGPTQTAFAGQATMVATGRSHTCFGRPGGLVASCFGANTSNQLTGVDPGPGPVDISATFTFADMQAGLNHTCGRRADGTIDCWGSNAQGQLGADPMMLATSDVLRTVTLSPAGDLAVGRNFTCARVNTQVHCWGQNTQGQLGDGTGVDNFDPATLAALPGEVTVTSLIAATDHVCAIVDDGDLICWGSNANGQLMLPPDKMGGDQLFTLTPVDIDIDNDKVIDFSGGATHSCVLTVDGRVLCWGTNSEGQIGDGSTAFAFDPTQVQVSCP